MISPRGNCVVVSDFIDAILSISSEMEFKRAETAVSKEEKASLLS